MNSGFSVLCSQTLHPVREPPREAPPALQAALCNTLAAEGTGTKEPACLTQGLLQASKLPSLRVTGPDLEQNVPVHSVTCTHSYLRTHFPSLCCAVSPIAHASCRSHARGLEIAFCCVENQRHIENITKKVNLSAVQTLLDHMLYTAERQPAHSAAQPAEL